MKLVLVRVVHAQSVDDLDFQQHDPVTSELLLSGKIPS